MRPPVVSIVGYHDSGKTHLIVELVALFTERGLCVGTVKHAAHANPEDMAGTDTAEQFEAGARRVLLVGEDALMMHWIARDHAPESLIESHFTDCDIVLAEGFKHGPFPKIEVYRRGGAAREPLAGTIEVAAVVSDDRVVLPDHVRIFRRHDILEIADFVEALGRSAESPD